MTLAIEAGTIGFVNVYAPQSPAEWAEVWQRMQDTLESGIPWFMAGDFNFVERRRDKTGGTKYMYREEEAWPELRGMVLGVGDP